MPLLDRQRRATELGRIRIGTRIERDGKMMPVKLDGFRFTSPDQAKIRHLAERYGGEVRPWESPTGEAQWDVSTPATVIPVRIPPGEPLSAWYERWPSARGCDRRCDGLREQFSAGPCLCPPDLGERKRLAAMNPPQTCRPTTRLSVLLADVPGLGVWVLTSRGDAAADEMAGVAELLHTASVQGMILPATLRLSKRETKNVEGVKRYVVPVLDVAASFAALEAGVRPVPALEQQQQPAAALPTGTAQPATPAALPPAGQVIDAVDDTGAAAQAIADQLIGTDRTALDGLWQDASRDRLTEVEIVAPDGTRMPLRAAFRITAGR